MCDAQLRVPLLSKKQNAELSYLTATGNGDSDMYFGPKSSIQNSDYRLEVLFVIKQHEDLAFSALYPGQNVVGIPPSYRTVAERLQLDCKDKKVLAPSMQYFDADNNLVSLYAAPAPVQPIAVNPGSPFDVLLKINCATIPIPDVGGTYQGTDNAANKNGQGEVKISIIVKQNGSNVSVSFKTATGGEGEGTGTLTGSKVSSISLRSTVPGCPGSYQGSLDFSGDTMNWSYQGNDCGGVMEGHGTAMRTKT
jgi:hypothetical protein